MRGRSPVTATTEAMAGGVHIEYETFGAERDPAVLLIMGLGAQLLCWDDAFCRSLARRGFRVIRFDNRDCGLSTHFDGVPADPAPYLLSDMADDAVALLDDMGIARAHVVGSSMGGMIAQTLAIEHPDRVHSLVSLMSNTGEPDFAAVDVALAGSLTSRPTADRDDYLDYRVEVLRHLAAGGHFDEERIRDREARCYDRAFYPEGAARQSAAIRASGPRVDGLRGLAVPTLVMHGRLDPIITVEGAVRTAQLVPDASLLIFEEMGHALPEVLWPQVIDAIADNAARAGTAVRT